MKNLAVEEAVHRIRMMEKHFDMLREASATSSDALQDDPALYPLLHALVVYYEGGDWLRDYELDEMGLLPSDLKRGVLSQDALYDFLESLKCPIPEEQDKTGKTG